ncbi:MAG TPA: ABC transporter permease subunit [Symbiobacteriaceae bacterium]|nr:ABC transporter permease subunit [Symbiobacteriaceae bacterium]
MQNRSLWQMVFRQIRRSRTRTAAAIFVVLVLAAAILAPLLSTHDPLTGDFKAVLAGPSARYWFGTDEVGRDIYTRIIWGARYSVAMGTLSVLLGGFLGVTLGLISGYFGGMLDLVVMRFIDLLLAFPGMLLAILIAGVLGAGFMPVVVAIAVWSVPTFARLTRGSTLTLKKREFVEAARSAGARDSRILVRHVLLNCFGPLAVYATLLLGDAILTAASLSFLGVGVAPPAPEWGAMISMSKAFMKAHPHVIIAPGLAVFLTVLAFNILGDALRDALDPKA